MLLPPPAIEPNPITNRNRKSIAALAVQHRLPAIYAYRYFVEDGGLISYGAEPSELYRRAAAMQYDADEQPDPDAWLELDEAERIDLVIDYHRRTGVQLENPDPHVIAHVVVENQVSLGEATPVPETLERLMDEGLDRHDAVHAIGSILMETVFAATHERDDGGGVNARARCTNSRWLALSVDVALLGSL